MDAININQAIALLLTLIIFINLRHINVVDENGKKPNIGNFFLILLILSLFLFAPLYFFAWLFDSKVSIFDVETLQVKVWGFVFLSLMAILTRTWFDKPKEIGQKIKEIKQKEAAKKKAENK